MIIVWESKFQDSSKKGVFGQIIGRSGNKINKEFRINSYYLGDQQNPVATNRNEEGFVVCWQSNASSGDEWDIIAKKLPCNYTSMIEGSAELNDYILYHNYPNPFNSSTTISYYIPKLSDVKLVIYDLQGRKIKTIIDEQIGAGNHKVNFNASGLPSGIYFYKLQVENDFTGVKKMMLLK